MIIVNQQILCAVCGNIILLVVKPTPTLDHASNLGQGANINPGHRTTNVKY